MKTKLATALCVLTLCASTVRCSAGDSSAAMAADVLIVRPVCLVATIVGTALFLISLPIAATTHSVDSTAHALVVMPARATFTRPIGDFESLSAD